MLFVEDEGVNPFVETEPYEVGFANHYETYLKPQVHVFEKRRNQAVQKFKKNTRRSIIIVAAVVALLYFDIIPWLDGASGAAVVFLVVFSIAISRSSLHEYRESVKEKVFPHVLSFLGEYSFDPKPGSQMNRFEGSQILPDYHVEKSEDRTVGTYKGVNIEFFETILQKPKQTVFHGVVIKLSVKKLFKGHTIVVRDRGLGGNFFKKIFSGSLEKASLEDPRFEDTFEVFTTDQVEARYLLTASFMERLLNLHDVFEGKGVQCSFYEDMLLIMIPSSKNLFEAGSVWQRVDFIDDAKAFLKEMNQIFSVIDILMLDQDTGL